MAIGEFCCVGFHLIIMEISCPFDDTFYDSENEAREAFQWSFLNQCGNYTSMSWWHEHCLFLIPRPGDPENKHKEETKTYPLTTIALRQIAAAAKTITWRYFLIDWFSICAPFFAFLVFIFIQHQYSVQSDIECLFSLLAPSCAAWLLFAPSALCEFITRRNSRAMSLIGVWKWNQNRNNGINSDRNVSFCDDFDQLERKMNAEKDRKVSISRV